MQAEKNMMPVCFAAVVALGLSGALESFPSGLGAGVNLGLACLPACTGLALVRVPRLWGILLFCMDSLIFGLQVYAQGRWAVPYTPQDIWYTQLIVCDIAMTLGTMGIFNRKNIEAYFGGRIPD